jgi:type II secretion system protein G
MYSIKKSSQGFTIVELLIVIVVIGILAALVLNSFTGVQARARDTERRTDINAIATQLEVYYNDNGGYPTAAQLLDDAAAGWVETNLKGFDKSALTDPKGVKVNGTSASYTYTPAPTSCTGATGATPCTSFSLTADMEKQTDITKNSLNN